MITSLEGRKFIESFEARRLKAYRDSVGVWTIGIGHTSMAGSPTVNPGMMITDQQCDDIFDADLRPVERKVEELVKVPISQKQFDALVSFSFNVGTGALAKSTLLKRVNAHQFDLVPAEFMKWANAGGKELSGLVRRRRAEAAMWREIDRSAPIMSEESGARPDTPQPKKTIGQSKEANAALATGALASAKTASDVVDQISSANDTVSTAVDLLHSPSFWIMIAIVGIAGAIWYWRKRRLDEEGA